MDTLLQLWEKILDLIGKAFPVVLGASVVQALQSKEQLNEIKEADKAAAVVDNGTLDERKRVRNKWL